MTSSSEWEVKSVEKSVNQWMKQQSADDPLQTDSRTSWWSATSTSSMYLVSVRMSLLLCRQNQQRSEWWCEQNTSSYSDRHFDFILLFGGQLLILHYPWGSAAGTNDMQTNLIQDFNCSNCHLMKLCDWLSVSEMHHGSSGWVWGGSPYVCVWSCGWGGRRCETPRSLQHRRPPEGWWRTAGGVLLLHLLLLLLRSPHSPLLPTPPLPGGGGRPPAAAARSSGWSWWRWGRCRRKQEVSLVSCICPDVFFISYSKWNFFQKATEAFFVNLRVKA